MAYVSKKTTRRVRGELKQRFPNLKFSVSKKDGTLRVRIMAGDLDFRDIWEDIPDNKQYWKRYGNPKPHFDGYVSINTYHPDTYNPKYTDIFKKIISIMKGTEWFDNSDPQIDYFSTAYYLKLSVGKWDQLYQYTGTPRMDDIFRRFRGEEFEAQLSEYLYKCDACGHITDVRFSDVYSDKYCREACARGRPEKCRGSCGKNGWDVEFTGVYHAGLSQRPSIDTKYGVIISCKDCEIGFYGDARWELYDELPDKSQAEEYRAEGEGEMSCNDKLNEAYDWIGFHNGEENLRKFMDSIGITDEDLDAEGEDITLKDSAKLGFGLGAGLLGFRVVLFGASALVGGLLLNRNK